MFRNLAGGLAALAVGLACAVVGAQPPPPPEPRFTPADALAMVANDLKGLGRVPTTIRYLWLGNLPDAKARGEWRTVMAGHLNTLSRGPELLPVVAPGKDGRLPNAAGVVAVGEYLLRFDALDFGQDFFRSWERCGAGVEPFWHDVADQVVLEDEYEEVEELVEYGFWVRPDGTRRAGGSRQHPDERWEATKKVREKVRRLKASRKVKGFAYWVAETEAQKQAMEVVEAKLAGTDVPVLAADWFLRQSAVQFKRDPGYYDFVGIKDLKGFEFAVGFVERGRDPAFLTEMRAAVGRSREVTGENVVRRVGVYERDQYWFTQDSNLEQAKDIDRANAKVNLGDDYEFQAVETYGLGANGLWKTGLFNDRGERQDVAPDFIASDSTAPGFDRRVHVNLSCIRCHTDGGLKDVDDWVRNVSNWPPNLLAVPKDADEARRLRQQYARHLEPALKAGRERHSAALFAVTGQKVTAYATLYARAWKESAVDEVDVARAARDLGCTPKQFQDAVSLEALERKLLLSGVPKDEVGVKLAAETAKIDPRLAVFRPGVKKGYGLSVPEWYAVYGRAQDAMRGKVRPARIEKKVK